MAGLVTGSFVMAAVGAYYLLSSEHQQFAKTCISHGVVTGALASVVLLYPTGHGNALQVFQHQPVKGAAFEGQFRTETGAGLVLVGQPNLEAMTIDNPLIVPNALSFFGAQALWSRDQGVGRFSPEGLARQYCPVVLRVSRHGRVGNHFYRHHAPVGHSAGIGTVVSNHLGFMGAHAQRTISVHCEYRRVDDRRRHITAGAFRQCLVYADWIFRPLSPAWTAFSIFILRDGSSGSFGGRGEARPTASASRGSEGG